MINLFIGIPLGNFEGIGPLSNVGSSSTDAIGRFVGTLSTIIGVLTICGAIWFIFQLITASLAWISSGSDKQSLENAKKKIMNALIGLIIVVFAYSFISLVGFILGIDLINLDTLIEGLQP